MEVGDNNPFWNHKHQRLFRQHSSVVERIYYFSLHSNQHQHATLKCNIIEDAS